MVARERIDGGSVGEWMAGGSVREESGEECDAGRQRRMKSLY